jgi:hypothetical protein
MNHVSIKALENQIAELNRLAGVDGCKLWTYDGNRFRATVGMYYLDQAYGGCNLAQIVTDGGGITLPLGHGMRTKRELHAELCAYLMGMNHADS